VNQEEICYDVCISDIMRVLKQEILGQIKEENGISSGFYKAIEEMEESEVGYAITSSIDINQG